MFIVQINDKGKLFYFNARNHKTPCIIKIPMRKQLEILLGILIKNNVTNFKVINQTNTPKEYQGVKKNAVIGNGSVVLSTTVTKR